MFKGGISMAQNRAEELEFNISKRQERTLSSQLDQAYLKSDLCQIGQSKFTAKNKAREMGANNSHEVGKSIGIYSYASEDKLKNQWHKLGEFAFSNGTKHISAIKDTDVKEFIGKMIDNKYSYNTIKQYCSSLEKMDVMLSKAYPQNRGDWQSAIAECRATAKEKCSSNLDTRAYSRPNDIIKSMPEKYQLASSMQLEHGLRKSDACYFKKIDNDRVKVNSKNGQEIIKELTPKQKELFQKYNSNGIYSVNRDKYEYQLKKACKETGQAWNGSHGLRHNYAQNRMNELSGRMSYGEAMLQTSKEMGHHRMEITQKYLR